MDRPTRTWLLVILTLSLCLNLWSIDFGLPENWHPDELNSRAVAMLREFSLNPHSFLYGSLHYYLTSAVMVPAYLFAKVLSLPEPAQKTAAYVAARALSAVLGTGCVALLFVLTRALFDRLAALLAALFLTLTMGFVSTAHFGTVDVPMLFWMLASYCMSAYVLNSGDRRWYVLAGVFAGLAAGTKYVGGVAILGLAVAHLLASHQRRHVSLLLGFLASMATFVAANPPLLFASCEFLEGFVMDNAFNTVVGTDIESHPWHDIITAIYVALGASFSILAVMALPYGVGLLAQREQRARVLFVLAMLVAFAMLISNLHYATSRHILPILPPLLILISKMIADMLNARMSAVRYLGVGTVVAATVFSGLYTLAAEFEFTFDTRYAAAAWIEEAVPAGASIEVTSYGPWISPDRFAVLQRPRQRRNLDATIATIEESGVYRWLHPIYWRYKVFAEDVGICEPRERHYIGWYEQSQANLSEVLQTFDPAIEGLEARNPDIVIVSDLYYNRFEEDYSSPEASFFKSLLAGRSDYQQVATFHYGLLPWPDPDIEFINPTIRIFRRQPAESGVRSALPSSLCLCHADG